MIFNLGTCIGLASLLSIAAISIVCLRRKIRIDKKRPLDTRNDFNEPW